MRSLKAKIYKVFTTERIKWRSDADEENVVVLVHLVYVH